MTVEAANRLAELVGDLPIAVAAAAAWLAETGTSVSDYVRQIELRGPHTIALPDLPDTMAGADDQSANNLQSQTLQAVWDLSLTRLRQRSPGAYRMLQLCSVMDPSIGLDLVYSDELAAAVVPHDPSVAERLVRGRLVQELNRLALVRIEARSERQPGDHGGGRITVHRLVQHVVRSRMTEEEVAEARRQMHLVLARSRPGRDVDDPDLWPTFRLLWPHLEVSGAVRSDNESVRRLLIDRVRYLWIVGDFARGLDRGRQTEAVWVARLKEMAEDPQTSVDDQLTLRRQLLHLRFNMANNLRSLGQFEESRDINAAVLAEQRELVGKDHPHTLMTAGSLSADLRCLGQYDEALERDKVTHAAWSETFGDEHPRTLAALNNLATSYRIIGDYRRALELDEAAHRGRKNALGDRHAHTLQSAGHIGRDLREAGEYERSVTILRVVAQSFAEAPTSVARETLNANANLAISLRSAGRPEESAKLLDEAYEQLHADVPYGPDTLACRLSRSVNMLSLDDDAAESELMAVLGEYRSRLGAGHPHTIVCVSNLAMALRANQRPLEARKLAEEAARDFAKVLGPDHPYTLGAETNLAVCTAECDRLDQALVMLTSTADRTAPVLGAEHPDTLRVRANLSMIKYRLGEPAQLTVAMTLAQELANRIGERHPTVSALRQERLLHRVIDPQPF